MSEPDSGTGTVGGLAGYVTRWLSIASVVLTLTFTALNAFWSHQISKVDTDLKVREANLKDQQFQLDVGKGKLERYSFVRTLLDGVLNQNPSQRTLTVNLISLALTRQEAEQLFSGLEASGNQQIREVASLGNELVNRRYTIYLHLGKYDGSGVETLGPINEVLTTAGFRIAGNDDKRDQYGPGVDYFFKADKVGAEKVADILNKSRDPNKKRFVARFQSANQKEGVLGIWF